MILIVSSLLLLMGIILPFVSCVVKLEGESCGRVVDNSRTQLRVELREADPQIVKRSLRIVQTILERVLALDHLRDLALDLATLLDHHLAQQLLTQLGDRHDRTGTTRTLAGVGGGLVCTVVALVAHAIIIQRSRSDCKRIERYFL